MYLSELLKGMFIRSDIDIKGITNNSNEVKSGYLFIAAKGSRADGNQFVEDAIRRGAVAVLSENKYPDRNGVFFIKTDLINNRLPQIAKIFYGNPSSKLDMVGVTGTNGKTTTAYILKSIYEAAGIRTGLLGTIEYLIGDRRIPAALTTPDVLKVNQYLSQMIEDGCKACVMEASSHALDQGRVFGVNFMTGIYTNLGRDHLDYHETIENYLEAKTKLFGSLAEDKWAIINIDDPYSNHIIQRTKANVLGYGIDNVSIKDVKYKLKARSINITSSGMKFSVYASELEKSFSLETKLIGRHNIYNILGSVGAAMSFGVSEGAIKEGVFTTDDVPGRMEKIDLGQPFDVFVDFAHTPDAMENVLNTIREIVKGKIILVFGCGGDRDKEKRPLMGRVASRMADYTVITSDNPRTEDPMRIISDIERGFNGVNYKVVEDRREAIRDALGKAEEGDVVFIAGKGHENYQILKNTVIPFSDKDVVEALLKEYAGSIC